MSDPLREWRDQIERVRRITESPAMRELLARREEVQRTIEQLRGITQLPPELIEAREQIQRTLDEAKASIQLPPELLAQQEEIQKTVRELKAASGIPCELAESQRRFRDLLEELNAVTYPLTPPPGRLGGHTLGTTLPTDVVSASVFFEKSGREAELERQSTALKAELRNLRQAYDDEIRDGETRTAILAQLTAAVRDVTRNGRLQNVFHRLEPDAGEVFLESPAYQEEFLSGGERRAYVMSIDLRRSTDLMLKARTPEGYARFITGLSELLRSIVFEHHGVFDKFTGDGILAFFPEFHTGPDAGYYALTAAAKSHVAFAEHYGNLRSSFTAVLSSPDDVGLGIGIDYGDVYTVGVGPELAIVGVPVVYACRMSGGPAGVTFLNQPARDHVVERWRQTCTLVEGKIDAKRDGHYVAYAVTMTESHGFMPAAASWMKHKTIGAGERPATTP